MANTNVVKSGQPSKATAVIKAIADVRQSKASDLIRRGSAALLVPTRLCSLILLVDNLSVDDLSVDNLLVSNLSVSNLSVSNGTQWLLPANDRCSQRSAAIN